METANRRQGLVARREGQLDTAAFVKLADKFIALANRENARVNATDLHMAFLYAAAFGALALLGGGRYTLKD